MVATRRPEVRVRMLAVLLGMVAAGCGTHTAVGGGLGAMGYVDEGGGSKPSFGPMFALRLAVPERGLRGMLAVDFKPSGPRDPDTNAQFRPLILLPSLQTTSPGRASFRFGLGPALCLWPGDGEHTAICSLVGGTALSLDWGPEQRRSWSLEFSGTVGPGSGALSALGGIQVLKYIR